MVASKEFLYKFSHEDFLHFLVFFSLFLFSFQNVSEIFSD